LIVDLFNQQINSLQAIVLKALRICSLSGEISIVAVGPLTNLALAMRMDPMFASKMKSLYVMGGNTEGVGNITIAAEFNFHCDPEAAFIVLKNTVVPTVIVAWELCYKHCEISWVSMH